MAASYADVLLGKLALEYRVVTPAALRECLDAQEAGRRAGVSATLGQVLIKRGYLSHAALNRLEQWREYAERARRCNLSVQILLRHGRPGEAVLREAYERVKQGAFREDIGRLLETEGRLSTRERLALEAALERAWVALYRREAEELHERLRSASGAWWTGTALSDRAAPVVGDLKHGNPYRGHLERSGVYRAAVAGAREALPQETGAFRAAIGVGRAPAGMTGRHGAAVPPSYRGATAPPSARALQGGIGADPQRVSDATTAHRRAQPHLWPGYNAAATGAHAPAPPRQSPFAPPQYTRPQVQAYRPQPVPAPPVRRRPSPLADPTCDVPGYECVERVGRGRLGVVYKARRQSDERIVALRILFPSIVESAELVERFYEELERAKAIAHPNIVRMYDGGEVNGHLFQVMEWIDGESLQARLNLHGSMRETEVLRFAAQIARAMDHYARQGLIHGDIRPSAIMQTRIRRAVLCELGVDIRAYEEYLRSRHALVRSSPHYVSPEQGLGAETCDVRADIYALGVVMFHALTGRVPFEGANPAVVISKHAREPLPDPRSFAPAVSVETAQLLRKMCAKRPEERHESPRQLLAEIAWVHSERAGGSTPIVPLDPPLPEDLERVERTKSRPKPRSLWRRWLAAIPWRRRRT